MFVSRAARYLFIAPHNATCMYACYVLMLGHRRKTVA